MEFDWDQANVAHIARHGITPEGCEEAYRNGPVVIEVQERRRESRTLCLGETNEARLLTFVVTPREGFITAHPMHAKQQEIYR